MNKEKYNGKEWPVREVTDLKDIICSSSSMFAEKAAYLYKDSGEWKPVLYKQVKQDMDALGTRLIDLGLKGEKIAVIGETSYLWFLTYFATVCGVGVIVPLDRKERRAELARMLGGDPAAGAHAATLLDA